MITFLNIGHYGRLCNQLFQYGVLYIVTKKNGYNFALPSDNFKIVKSSPNPVIGKRDYMYLQLYECFNVTGKLLPKSEIHFNRTFDHGKDYSKFNTGVFDISDNTNIKGFVLTDVDRDGTLNGLNIDMIKTSLKLTTKPLVVGGGLTSYNDLNNLKKIFSENLEGIIAGKSFYIVGLHPNSSRLARRSPFTAIAFNLHWQFEKLREMGTFIRVRNTIRKRVCTREL